jgi:hypothetical protein
MVSQRMAVLTSSLLAVFLLSATALTYAQSALAFSWAQDMNFTLEGKITSNTANKLTVSTEENMVFHVLYNERTEIKKKDGSPGTARDLQVGIRIGVAGDLAESGEITAKKIEIQTEGSEKKSVGEKLLHECERI